MLPIQPSQDATSYQFIDPSFVGNTRRTVVSELSGRQNILKRLRDIGVDYDGDLNERANAILTRVKKLESIGYSFEGADASVQLMMLHATRQYCPPFKVRGGASCEMQPSSSSSQSSSSSLSSLLASSSSSSYQLLFPPCFARHMNSSPQVLDYSATVWDR